MSIRAIVVEDEPLVREALADFLEAAGIDVVGIASGGAEAISSVAAFLPDVVIMDLRLPGMDGVEATRIIKESYPFIRIIMLSVHDDIGFRRPAFEAGADAYLHKGCDPTELLATVKG
jgi:DNA-binding NarL/FixJ family response regulator